MFVSRLYKHQVIKYQLHHHPFLSIIIAPRTASSNSKTCGELTFFRLIIVVLSTLLGLYFEVFHEAKVTKKLKTSLLTYYK
jgi:hypothetical protein